MRDWLVLVMVVATIPLAFYRPFLGLLGFSWLAYMRPQDLAWGLAASLPLSKYVALALYSSLILRGKINLFRRGPITGAMLALWIWLLISCCTAQYRDVAFEKLQDISKVFIIAFATVVLVTNVQRFRISMAFIGISLGFLGLKFGVFGLLRGGVHFTKGVGGMIGDNNDFALALNMAIPILVYLAHEMRSRWVRLAAIGMVPLTAMTVLFTQSRGGFLSLCALTLYLIVRGRRKVLTLFSVGIVALLGSLFLPQTFYERIGTITSYQSDSSAKGRLNAWEASYNMAKDYPIFGVGLDNFLFEFREYAPDPDDIHVAHNTYLQVLAEAGFFGLGLYLLLFVAFWRTMWSVRRRARRYRMPWAMQGAQFLEASVIAFMVGGTFLNRAHFDLIYHVIILGCCLDRILKHEVLLLRREMQDKAELSEAA